MKFERIWILRGANVWARCPVLEVELDLADLAAVTDERLAVCVTHLHAWLPALAGQFIGANIPAILRDVTLELQRLAGSPVKVGLVRPAGRDGCFRVVIEYEEEELGRACLETARQLCLAALHNHPCDISVELARLRELANDVRLGPSTAAIVRAARQRNIPVRRLNSSSLVQLGHGSAQRRICTAETDATSALAEMIAQDKQLTRALLHAVGVPVPQGRPVADADDAWLAAEELGLPVVVKPQYGNHGRGVATNLSTREQVAAAYAAAREEGSSILVEQFMPGADHRLLVVGDHLLAAALREPAHVIGDGRSTIAQLVAEVNRDPRRSDGHATVLSFIHLDTVGLAVLAEQGYTPDAVPPAGQRVLIRRNGNLSTGGTAEDVTDRVHPEVAARAIEAARAIGLDIAGVDVIAVDIGQPLEDQRGGVVEVNAGPGLRMHLEPSAGQPRPVGEAIIASLFSEGQTGRIPLIAVTGVNGKTTTTRLIAHLLRQPNRLVGMACTDGLYVGDRRIDKRDCSGPRSARNLLLNPRVDAAVVETARGGILREGLGFDRCHVAIVTNIGQGDHLNLRGIDTLEDLARVKRTLVESVAPNGVAVLNAADPLVAAMADHCPGRMIFFARDAGHPVLTAHQARGERAVFVRSGTIVLTEDDREEVLLALEDVPMTHGGYVGFQVENALAACAAVWSLGLPLDALREGLASFRGDAQQVPGRFNVFRAGNATVLVDYAHNPSALSSLVEALDAFPSQRRSLVFTACDRRDADVLAIGQIIGDGFDRVFLYPDGGSSDRHDGELNALLRRGIATGKRITETIETASERAAIETALADLHSDELLVLGIESIEDTLALVQAHLPV
ncbi:MAG TPA: cyanophycin synthetase [Gemmataceae bacterium]|nr:cyanophycin synthetase [Gemmataceae bacterium]